MIEAIPIAAGLASFAATWAVRRYALASNLIDVPNDRSSHAVATPRGGGLAIVVAIAAALAALYVDGSIPVRHLIPWLLGGGAISLVGFIDDRRGLKASVRFAVHATAGLLLIGLTGVGAIPWPAGVVGAGWLTLFVAWVGILWSINLFNFMDGTDGLASSEAMYIFLAAASIRWWTGLHDGVAILMAACAAGSAGFLFWNWPPAKIFMGDVGSGFLGFAIAACATLASSASSLTIWTWVVLGGTFAADATVTLAVRAIHGEKVYEAHRGHVYQRLSRRWNSHRAVLLLNMLINVLWLLPLAIWTVIEPRNGMYIAVVALAPLAVGAVRLGGGQPGDLGGVRWS